MFAVTPEDPALIVLDWQGCGIGPSVRDIGYFLIFSLTVKDRHQGERKLLETYHTSMVEQGVHNSSLEQCWQDYRLAFFRNLKIAVNVTSFAVYPFPMCEGRLKL